MCGTTRQEARERLGRVLGQLLDKMIPEDESVPLRDGGFLAWEEQATELEQTLCTAWLEERAALEQQDSMVGLGRCPDCGSGRLYLLAGTRQVPRQTRHGPVVLEQQSCRCRACGRTFSPSGTGLGLAHGRTPVAGRRTPLGPGSGGAELRQRCPGPP
jgi:DNA-directed RNA polymerase subunit RPC12/RpoP